MLTCRIGGSDGLRLEFHDPGDVVVIRTTRHGARHDVSPLGPNARIANRALRPLFGVAAAGVGVWHAPEGNAEELAREIDSDPSVQFAGRGLRDSNGAPVVYTENVFVKFLDDADPNACVKTIASVGLSVKRDLGFARNAYFAEARPRTGRRVFDIASELLEHADVELCHPELIRQISWNAAFPAQWHLAATDIDGVAIHADANVVPAWGTTKGRGIVIAVIDNGVDIDHEEFASAGKIVAPRSVTRPVGSNPRPAEAANHGTACAGVACADGRHGASGVAPRATLMPLRLDAGLGSVEEAEAFEWAADHGAHVISCSWGPVDGDWFDPNDPVHQSVVPLPDSTRLAINHATEAGRGGRGCVICWAAGNGNESVDNDGYASYERVIAVAACNESSVRSTYSDMGDAVWCAFPSNEVVDPVTTGIWTTDRSNREGYNPGDTTLGDAAGNYTNSFGGTSSACPGVAGVAALALSANGDLGWRDVRDVLRDSCDRIDQAGGDYDANSHSASYGYGRVNAERAVELAAERA